MTSRWTLLVFILLIPAAARSSTAADRALLEAVDTGSPNAVRQVLQKGADPNVYFGKNFDQKPLCLATRKGNEQILQMLLAAGADANVLYFPNTDIFSDDLLTCAAASENFTAFKTLVEAGAEVDRNLCSICDETIVRTVLAATLHGDTFDMTRYIVENSELSVGQTRALARAINRYSVYADYQTLDDREWIANWLRERGHDVTPREPWPARQ